MNLLIVNDERLTADTMKDTIQWDRYGIDEVFAAYNAEDARTCINARTIDIMLCDIEMPEENGLSLLRWARDNGKAVECVFLTCHASFEYAKEAIGLDCQDYLLIPAKYDEIGNAIKKVVTRIVNSRNENRFSEYGKIAFQKMIDEIGDVNGDDHDPQKLIQAVKQHIIKNLGEETLSVSSIAEGFFIHPVYMNRVFKKKTGVSVSQYIINERMYLAKQLLENGKINAEAVAKRVGYCNYPHFSSAFKKYYGYSPSKIMRSARK